MSDAEHEYRCLVPFTDQSPSFVHGFQCGAIWQEMQGRGEIEPRPVNSINRLTLERMCDAAGYVPVFKPTEMEEWIEFSASPAKGGLRVYEGTHP